MARTKALVVLGAATVLTLGVESCGGFGPGGGSSGGFAGTYDCTGTTTTPAGTSSGTGTFYCTGNSCADSMHAFVGTVDGNGNFSGTDTLCQTCVPLPMTGQMSTSGPFTLSGQSGNVSATFHCQCHGACGGGSTGGGSDGGTDGGSGGDGGPIGPQCPIMGPCTGQWVPGGTVTCEGSYPTDVTITLTLCGTTISVTSISATQLVFTIPPMTPSVCQLEVSTHGGGSGQPVVIRPVPATIAACASGSAPLWVAVDAAYVYWTESGGAVRRAPVQGGQVTTLASGLSSPQGIAVDANNVYWADSAGVKQLPKGGGSSANIGPGMASFVAVDASYVYWTANGPANTGAVKRVAIGGGTPLTLVPNLSNPKGIAVDASAVYFADSAGAIRKVALAGGTATTLAGAVYPSSVAVYGGNVYWTQYTNTVNGVFMVPTSGGTAATLWSQDGQGVAADASGVYWTAWNGGSVNQYGVESALQTIQVSSDLAYPTGIATDATSIYVAEQTPGGRILRLTKPSP